MDNYLSKPIRVAELTLDGGEDFKRRFDLDDIKSVKLAAVTEEPLLLDHLERFSSQWWQLVSVDPDLRARILRLIGQKFGLGPNTLAALGGEEQEVQAAHQQLFGEPIEALSSQVGKLGKKRARSGGAARARQDVETRLEWLILVSGEILYRTADPGDADRCDARAGSGWHHHRRQRHAP